MVLMGFLWDSMGLTPLFSVFAPKKTHSDGAKPIATIPTWASMKARIFRRRHASIHVLGFFFCCCDDHGRYFKPNMAGFSSYNWGNLEFINELLNAVSYFLKQHQFAWSRSTRTISHIHNSIRCQLYRHEYHEFGWWKAHQIIEINIIPVWIHCL